APASFFFVLPSAIPVDPAKSAGDIPSACNSFRLFIFIRASYDQPFPSRLDTPLMTAVGCAARLRSGEMNAFRALRVPHSRSSCKRPDYIFYAHKFLNFRRLESANRRGMSELAASIQSVWNELTGRSYSALSDPVPCQNPRAWTEVRRALGSTNLYLTI